MAEGSPVSAYAAQAVAARTYAYHQTQDGQVALNNTSGCQVYIPYRYEGLGEGLGEERKAQRQAGVDQAVADTESRYMTFGDEEAPIKAHFGMDNCTYTGAGAYPYLVSVHDPISAKPDPCYNSAYGTGYGGLGIHRRGALELRQYRRLRRRRRLERSMRSRGVHPHSLLHRHPSARRRRPAFDAQLSRGSVEH